MLRKYKKQVIAVAASNAAFVGSSAMAALPTEATSAITAVGTSVTDAETAVWPVIGLMLVAAMTIKVVKRFVSKI